MWPSSPAVPVALAPPSAGGLAAEGGVVAVFDINPDSAEQVAADIRASGGRAEAFVVDLTRQDSVEAAVSAVESQLGPVDILVNNAGWDHAAPFLKTDKGAVGQDCCRQSVRPAVHAPRRAQGYGCAWCRQGGEHRLRRRPRRLVRRSRVRLLQGRAAVVLENHGARAGAQANQY